MNDWLFPMMVVPKKNGKLRVCVDFRKLNEQTIKDPFPLPFTDTMLDWYNGYDQIKLAPEDQEKTSFITEWGASCFW